ncbi:DUF1835 domain-containing protein [Paenibacillus glycanilyticus]|uniref:DUF1835 domain-containing protein n=1 Tax=Paenibacillus glycanilyticus TaxID=126569 RepID=A0ABQ6GFS7_9BACL|nr:DUF1835 domain-containing protein [Paenibacillus glycanilyticus]GLX68193.1 hypothetical protein MU1_25380 [Paenibacillus glycanilyticus]
MNRYIDSINELNEWELRTFLNELLEAAENGSESDQLLRQWTSRVQEARAKRREIDRIESHVHIVFSLSDAGSLKVALSELGRHANNKVLAFNDMFSIGPLLHLDHSDGQRNRQSWMLGRFSPSSVLNDPNRESRMDRMVEQLKAIPEEKSIIVWCSNNSHDQMGLRLVMHLLKDRQQPVQIINLTESFPTTDNPPIAQAYVDREVYRSIVSQYETARLITPNERQQYIAEWEELSKANHELRLWQNGEIKGREPEAIDGIIVSAAVAAVQESGDDQGFVKAGTVVAKLFEHFDQVIGSHFIEYRIWTLISNGVFEFRGLPGALYQYSIKLG